MKFKPQIVVWISLSLLILTFLGANGKMNPTTSSVTFASASSSSISTNGTGMPTAYTNGRSNVNFTDMPNPVTEDLNDWASDSLSTAARVLLGILFVLGTLSGVLGNILVILAVALTKKLRSYTPNLWVCNLSITDFLVSAFSFPIIGVYMSVYWPSWPFHDYLCKISVYVANVCALESVLTLVFIAIDRYFAVVKNKLIINRRMFYILTAITWIATAGALSYPLTKSGGVTAEKLNNVTYHICQRMTGRHLLNRDFRNSALFKISAGFIIIFIIVGLYVRMGMTIFGMRHTPTERSAQNGKTKEKADQNKAKAVKMMFFVVILFLLSWGPYWVVTFLRVFPLRANHFVDPSIVLFTYTLAMLNSVWNPILYALLSRSFRRAYADILRGRGLKRTDTTLRSRSTMRSRVTSQLSVLSTETVKTPDTGRTPAGSTFTLSPDSAR